MVEWERPKSIPFPTVWATFEGNQEVNGVRRKYWIQDVADEYYDDVIHLMSTEFIKESILCKYSNFTEDPLAVQDYISAWKKMLKKKLTLICLTKNDSGDTQIVGCNFVGIAHKDDKVDIENTFKGRISKRTAGALFHVYKSKDVFSELKIDYYLSAFGLFVLPAFRREGIAYQILKARRELGLAVGVKISVIPFTSFGGHKVAEKLGFKDIIVFPYADLEKVNPLFKFPGIENDKAGCIRVMYKRYSENE